MSTDQSNPLSRLPAGYIHVLHSSSLRAFVFLIWRDIKPWHECAAVIFRRLCYFPGMEIRAANLQDLTRLIDLDSTIESPQYLHLDRGGEGLAARWALEERPLREKLLDPNPVHEDLRFALKQVLSGIEEGIVLAADHDGQLVGLALAQPDVERQTLRVIDVRIDYDLRREGLGSAMLFQIIAHARQMELRAVSARTLTNNLPAAKFFQKAGFELAGVNTHFFSNHDVVKEAVALFWYAALD